MFSYEFWDISCYRTPPVAASASLLSDKIPTEKILYIFIFLTWNFLLIYYQLGLKTFTLNGFWHLRKQEGAVIFHLFFLSLFQLQKVDISSISGLGLYTPLYQLCFALPTMFVKRDLHRKVHRKIYTRYDHTENVAQVNFVKKVKCGWIWSKRVVTVRVSVVGKWGYSPRPQVRRQMPRVDFKWVGRCCLSIVTIGHIYPLPRLSVHHLLRASHRKLPNEKKFLSFQQIQKNWTALL